MSVVNFIYPNDVKINFGLYPPLGISYLAAYIINKGYETRVFDMTFEDNLLEKLTKEKSIYAISITTPMSELGFKIASDIKKLNKENIVIVGGPHPTVVPEDCIKKPYIDFVVTGEGEITLYELLEAIRKGRGFDSVKGIYYKKNGKVARNPPREPIQNLDELPFPRQDLFPIDRYFKVRELREISLISSRGCYGDCTFCQPCVRMIFGHKFRLRSAKAIVDEIEHILKKYKADMVVFSDDTLGIKPHVEELCKEILRRKLDFYWRCQARINLDFETLKLMKKAGCIAISFGVESGDQGILDSIHKHTKVKQIKEVFRLCRKLGIFTNAFLMVGNIGETRESVYKTIELLREIKPFAISVSITTPYPGTHLFKEAKEMGYLREDMKWSELSHYSDSAHSLNLPTLSEREILNYRKLIKREFSKRGTLNRIEYVVKYFADVGAIAKAARFIIRRPGVILSSLKLMLLSIRLGEGVAFTNPKRTKVIGE